MKKIFFSLLILFFLVSCGPADIGPEVQNRLDTAYHDGWSSQINQKVDASLIGLPDQQYYQWYKLQMRTAPISGGIIGTWSHWQILPGYDPMYNGSTVSYNFVAQNATAYQFQIFVYGRGCKKVLFSTKCKDGDSGWIVSNAILKIDTTTPGNGTITASDRSTNQWKNDNITNLNYPVDRTGEVSTRVNTFCSYRNPDTGCTATGTTKPITNPLEEGKTTFKYKTCTQTGKCSSPSTFVTLVDTSIPQAPSITSGTHNSTIWLQNKSPKFSITANSPGPSPYLNYYCIKRGATDCDPNTIGSSKNYTNLADGEWYFRAKTCDTGGCSPISTYRIRIDTTPPELGHIDFTTPVGSFLKANSVQILGFTVNLAGGSPIASISAKMEHPLTPSVYSPPITVTGTGTFSHSFDISKVDGTDRNSYNYRPYTLQIISLCDVAGNCLLTSQNIVYNIYADAISLSHSNTQIDPSFSNGTAIADGSPKNIVLTLKDRYGNQVVPVSDTLGNMKRTLDFTFAHPTHSLRINQYDTSSTEGAVEFNYGATKEQANIGTTSTQFIDSDIAHSSGIYTFPVSVYTPTQNRDNKSIGEFILSLISVKLSDTPKIDIVTSPTVFSFGPLFSAIFSEDLKENGFIEGALQNSKVIIDKKSGATPSSSQLYLEFGSGASTQASSDFSLQVGNNFIKEGHKSSISGLAPSFASLSRDENISLGTLLTQALGNSILNLSSHYLSTHISYTLGGKDIVYNQDVIGKTNYHSGTISSNTSQEGIKIIGLTSADKKQELTQDQFSEDIRIIGKVTKASYKKDISQKSNELLRSLSDWTGTLPQVGDISGAKWNPSPLNSGENISEGKIQVFKNIAGKYVSISGSSLSNGASKTILVTGGDIYIKSDISATKKAHILAFVALKDSQGRGGNIYIDPNVKDISAVFYSEKSLMSARDHDNDGSISTTEVYSSQDSIDVLSNQLYIYGSVFSENTLGGARSNPLMCPYYVVSCTTSPEAQKYDLNYIRRYSLVDTDANNIPDTPANGGQKSLGGGTLYPNNPFIIEYNQNIQTSPPPLFSE